MNRIVAIGVAVSVGMTLALHGMNAMEELEFALVHGFIPKDPFYRMEQ